jgi:hypothetical protein
MTQYEREELVERYLSGEMTSAQEGEFFLVAAVDEELQRTLKAYRIMDRAMLNDRDTAVMENSDYRSRVMGMLAASHVAGTGSVTGSDAPRATTPAEEAPAGGFWRGFGASILGASLVAGMIVAISTVSDDATPAAKSPAPQQAAPSTTVRRQGAPVTGPSLPLAPASEASQEVRESAGGAARPVERRESRVEGRSTPRQTASETAAAPAEKTAPSKPNPVIQLPPKVNTKMNIPVEVDHPNAPQN